ncbi:lipopolysaccharide biosynthesis protein [Azospirillum canadense]|uniref:lipopolysaccharide biosynthesis protein n=1 Tax=Azospirillum canadense TaxID=403962 RepID=UPI002225E210|nr:lipopolysaccharide biosynthesis protein [Azospirillum canadense]MCW2238552.1 O-antigen/teichoic acid export membrane protein [Azospirillum canadense]
MPWRRPPQGRTAFGEQADGEGAVTGVSASAMPHHAVADVSTSEIRTRSVHGSGFVLALQMVRLFVRLGSMVIIARLLSPADFGLVAMVLPVVAFASAFQELGLGAATVQKASVTFQQISTLFWINAAASGVLAALLAVGAPYVAAFYGNGQLTDITIAFAGILLVSGLAAQHLALFRRQMRFVALSFIDSAAMVTGVALGLLAAWFGAGFWALVVMNGMEAALRFILLWIVSGWTPGRPGNWRGVAPMVAFGGNMVASTVIFYVVRHLDNILIGKYWGDIALGLYSRAYNLVLLPIANITDPVSGIVIAALSRLQNDPDQYRAYFLRAVCLTASLGMPVAVFCIVEAELVIGIVFGKQWHDAVPIYTALGPVAIAATFNSSTYWVYASLGRAERQLRWAVIASSTFALSFVLGLPYGPIGVGIAYSGAFCLLQLPSLAYCFRGTPIRLRDFLLMVSVPGLASLAASGATLVAHRMTTVESPIAALGIAGTVFSATYGAAYLAHPIGRQNLQHIRGILEELKSRVR